MIEVNKNKLIISIILASVLIFSGLLLISGIPKPATIQRKITLGAWTEGLYDASEGNLNPGKLLEFEEKIGKKVSIAHYYLGWEHLSEPGISAQFKQLNENGWEVMLNVNPYFFEECPASDLPLYKAISEGKCDEFLRKSGRNLSLIEKPFFLVFAWEMNNDNNEWSVLKSGSSNEDFVLAWRRIHGIFKEENAKVIWVFCPNVPEEGFSPYAKIYPGDGYTDWIGLDGYNWGTSQGWSKWIDFAGVFRGSYETITAVAPGKPLVLAEVNTTDKGGDKGRWYEDMFLKQIPENFPKIEAVIIFNEDKTKQENVNWKIDATSESLDAFKRSVNSHYYK